MIIEKSVVDFNLTPQQFTETFQSVDLAVNPRHCLMVHVTEPLWSKWIFTWYGLDLASSSQFSLQFCNQAACLLNTAVSRKYAPPLSYIKAPPTMNATFTGNYVWQFHVEIEGYSVAYFDHITVFEAPYRWTSVKGGAHMPYLCIYKARWAPPLMELQRYGAGMQSKYTTE